MTAIETIRADLKKAAAHQPEAVQPFIRTLRKQLGKYAKGNGADRAALRPMIEKSMAAIKKAGCGR